MFENNLLTDILYYSDKNCEIGKIKNCKYLNDFKYCRNDFMLCNKKLNYYVCISKDGELLSVWSHPIKNEDGNNYTPSEIMSVFRNNFTKNSITTDMVELFRDKPTSYKRKYLKCKKNTNKEGRI